MSLEEHGGGPAAFASSSPKDEGILKKWLNKLREVLKRLAGKTFEAMPANLGECCWCHFEFPGQSHWICGCEYMVFAFIANLTGLKLLQKVKNQKKS